MGQQIPPAKGKELLENWEKGPGNAIKGKGIKDAYETWFSVAELEEYLAYVKEYISDNPGIRIYFGKYNAGGGSNPVKGLTTVFLAPTKGGGNGGEEVNLEEVQNDYDLNAYNDGGVGWPPKKY